MVTCREIEKRGGMKYWLTMTLKMKRQTDRVNDRGAESRIAAERRGMKMKT